MKNLIDFYFENSEAILAILFGLYEIGVRLWPTYKNWSLIDLALRALPNRRKTLPIVFFALMSITSMAQLNGNFKSVRLAVNDTTSALPLNGTIIYNTPTQEFYVYQNFGWTKMVGGGSGGGLQGATNGLTVFQDTVGLGGTLISNAIIDAGASNTFAVSRPDGGGIYLAPGLGAGIFVNNGDGIQLNIDDSGGSGFVSNFQLRPDGIDVQCSNPDFTGITYLTQPDVDSYTLGSVTTKEYQDTHLNGYPTTDVAGHDGQVMYFNEGTFSWDWLTAVTNPLPNNQFTVSNGTGQFKYAGLVSTGNNDIRADGVTANTDLFLASEGTGMVSLSVGGTTSGVNATSAGATIRYQMNGTVGTDQILTVAHELKDSEFRFEATSTTANLIGGHRGTGPIAKHTFGIQSPSSNNNGNGGDDMAIVAGNGSTVLGHTSSPGGSISITSGNGGNDSNGGNLTLKAGTGTGTGVAGNIIILNLPTSAAGLPTGALWNNSGVLNIAP